MKLYLKHLVLALALFVSQKAFSAEDIISVQTIGYGIDRDTAVNDACVQACKQVNGFVFETEAARKVDLFSISLGVTRNKKSDAVTVNKLSSEAERKFYEQVKGAIKNYHEISCVEESVGKWKVVLKVDIVRYKTPGIQPESRRKLAVSPFTVQLGSYTVGAEQISTTETRNEFRDKLESLLVQSRRFTILDRHDTDAVLNEKQYIIHNAGADEYAKLGTALGTDYLLCGKISDLAVIEEYNQNIFTGANIPTISCAYVKLSYRIIVMPTGQIKWADDVEINLSEEQCKKLNGNVRAAYDLLINSGAQMVCEQSLGNIYPVRVVRVQENGQVVLGEGGSLHKEGDLFDVFYLGDVIVDPYSKESLGRDESWVATISLSRVEAKLSYADVIEGEISADAVNKNRILCRPVKPYTVQPKKKKYNEQGQSISIKQSGGVVLPFDKPKQKSDK